MLLMLLILQKPKLLLVMTDLLTVEGNTVVEFFSSKDVQFARVILLRTRFVIIQETDS